MMNDEVHAYSKTVAVWMQADYGIHVSDNAMVHFVDGKPLKTTYDGTTVIVFLEVAADSKLAVIDAQDHILAPLH